MNIDPNEMSLNIFNVRIFAVLSFVTAELSNHRSMFVSCSLARKQA